MVMSLTKTEQDLINGLKVFGVSKGTGAMIFVMLGEEPKFLDMINYMVNHRNATEQELLEQAEKIASIHI